MQEQKTQAKRSFNIYYIIAAALVVLLFILYPVSSCGKKSVPQSTYSRFTRDIGLISKPIGNWSNDSYEFKIDTLKDENGKPILIPNNLGYYEVPYSKVRAIVGRASTFYVLLRNDIKNNDTVANFLSKPDKYASYYFYYDFSPNVTEIWDAYNSWVNLHSQELQTHSNYMNILGFDPIADGLDIHGNALTETEREYVFFTQTFDKFCVEATDIEESSSWFNISNILSLLSLLALVVFGFFIIRSFSNRGGLGSMSRNRSQHTMGGEVRFGDVAGIEEEKEEVMEIVQFLKNPHKFLELGARIPKGVLLVGQPGTGKTLLAKAIAGEAGVHFFSISGSDFSEMLVGVGPSRMRDLFEDAKRNAPAIIFIDEIDSIARMRGVGVSGVSDENEQTLNQLLVQMDGFTKSEGVIVIAATNRPDVLDQALLRPGRFDRQIVVQLPDVKGREQILAVHAKGKPLGGDVDLKRVAQIISGFSGADIENLLNEAAIIAAKKDKLKINMVDITEGINKVLLGPQKKSRIITEDDKKITAYHEAGHAIVSRVLQPDQVVQEVSIIPRGMAAGYTLTNEKDIESHHKSKKFLTSQLAMLMAGRVAEQVFVGDICTGASNDIKVATDLAERMVTMFGMSEKLGPLYYGKEDEMALRLYNAQNPRSESIQSVIDQEIKNFIVTAEKQATEILTKSKPKVDVMAEILLARETIYAADVALIMDGKDKKEIIKEMEKREKDAKKQEEQERINAELEILNRDLDIVMSHAKRFVEAKLADPKKLEDLEKNFELARQTIKNGKVLTQLPTLDNLEEYANILKEESKSADESESK
jgi:cell division protease FtsH